MIPKIIHYCWFGGNPLPKDAKQCIKSWKKHCKGYKIIQWNEKNFDISSAPLYVRQAYEAKKWAFITDYVRLYAMTKFGGIYMDTDVEVVRSLDEFLKHSAFSGFENDTQIPTGIMASEKDFPLFKELLSYYDNASFINEDGSLNLTTNVVIITDMCNKYGFVPNGKYQEVAGFALYPKDYFCPITDMWELEMTSNTATIHWFSGSWVDSKKNWSLKRRYDANKRNDVRDYWKHLPNRILRKVLGDKFTDNIKKRMSK